MAKSHRVRMPSWFASRGPKLKLACIPKSPQTHLRTSCLKSVILLKNSTALRSESCVPHVHHDVAACLGGVGLCTLFIHALVDISPFSLPTWKPSPSSRPTSYSYRSSTPSRHPTDDMARRSARLLKVYAHPLFPAAFVFVVYLC